MAKIDDPPKSGGVFGANPKIEFQQFFDGEIREVDFEDVLEEIRVAMGEVGRINPTLGKSLSWNSLSFQNSVEGMGRLTHVMVTPKDGKTRIRMTESPGQHTVVFISMMFVAGVFSVVVSEALGDRGLLMVAPAAIAAIFGGSYLTLRTMFRGLIRRRHRMLKGLMKKLAGFAGGGSQPPLLEEARSEEEKATPIT